MIKVATIAGSDASGGAGLEADLKTFEEYGLYGMAAVTLIATMEPDNQWAHKVFPLQEDALRAQCETIFKGVGVSAVKTGMLGSFFAVDMAVEYIKKYKISNFVMDPVMVCKGAGEALTPELNTALEEKLLPLSLVVTPNVFEAQQLSGRKNVDTLEKVKDAAKAIFDKGAKNVFIKGPRLPGASRAVDIIYDGSGFDELDGELYKTGWTHGAGCTVSAAICAGLARSLSVKQAAAAAKSFISKSLSGGFALNQWVGPGNPSNWRGANLFSL
ncbi:MAG: bifunctional hydroxymethylpyrimidine kinase/phosphomethylpyrimidine kinase [Spirochaetaceae bacterium]|jgi:pyridoxine kinase|nr:bifunctional hydroxymethylpyrimidine kinase/phosphomethylpyrimidine kinase [Spirochaetaceae bacterium]